MSAETNDRPCIVATEGHKLSCKYWNSDCTSPKALVFISHGVGEHCLWYGKLANILVESNCYVFAHDHVGHGESEGERVQITDFKTYVADLFKHIDSIKSKFSDDMKIFIIGHSMGGAIATLAAIQQPKYFSGVVLIAPAFEFPDPLNFLAIGAMKITAAILPNLEVKKVDPKVISRDEEKVKAYGEDPLVWHGGIKAKWLNAMKKAMDDIRPAVDTIEWPFLTMHGTVDKLTGIQGSLNLHEKAKSEDKTLKIFDGFYHQLHSEPEPHATEVCDMIRDWIVKRM